MAQTACSLLDPQPKFSFEIRTSDPLYFLSFNTNSGLSCLFELSCPGNPESKYLHESNKLGPKPVFFIDLRNCLGII